MVAVAASSGADRGGRTTGAEGGGAPPAAAALRLRVYTVQRQVRGTSYFFTQNVNNSGGFLGPSSAVNICV